MTSSFEALRAFLEGEQAHREGRYSAAWEAYERAFTVDSTLWLAYWRYSQARSWMLLGTPQWIRDAYADHVDEFPRLDRELREAWVTVPRSARLEALRQFAERNQDYYPGWWRYGDAILHTHIVDQGAPLSEVIRAFERVVELNPGMISAWEHLLFCYTMERDFERYARVLEELERRGGREAILEGYGFDMVSMGWHTLAFERGEIGISEAADRLAPLFRDLRPANARMPGLLLRQNTLLGYAPLQIELLQRLAEDPGPFDPGDALMAEGLSWASRGAWTEALEVWNRMEEVYGLPAEGSVLYQVLATGVVLGGLEPQEARARRPVPDPETWPLSQLADQAWYDGLIGYGAQDLDAVVEARGRLSAMDTLATHMFEWSLEAFEADLRGDRDRARARLVELEEMRADSSVGLTDRAMYAVHRLKAAEWLREAGEPRRADSLLQWHQGMMTQEGTVRAALLASALTYLEMGRVEEARGLDEEALGHYREFLRRYDMPPARHEHLIEEARAAVERLGGGG
jgi:tetratricopeptide (TPR) repeat protein